MLYEVTVLLITIPDRGGPEPVDSLNMIVYFGFCTVVKVNVISKVLSDSKELKLWFSPKTIDCKCYTRLLSC